MYERPICSIGNSVNGLSAVPVQFDSFFERDTNTRTRGHSLKLSHRLRLQLYDLNYGAIQITLLINYLTFVSERIINLWNSLDLDEELLTASSLNSFKNSLVRLWK